MPIHYIGTLPPLEPQKGFTIHFHIRGILMKLPSLVLDTFLLQQKYKHKHKRCMQVSEHTVRVRATGKLLYLRFGEVMVAPEHHPCRS